MALSFEDLRVLKAAETLSDEIWQQIICWDSFSKEVIGSQLVRAIDSVGANIAESYGRYHFGEKLQFLYYARGSLFEAKYWINRSLARNLLTKTQGQVYANKLGLLARQLNSFADTIKRQRNGNKPPKHTNQNTLREDTSKYPANPQNEIRFQQENLYVLFSESELNSLELDPPSNI